jgi:hypothetical protein
MANLLSNTTVGGSAVITTSNIGSYALTSIPATISPTNINIGNAIYFGGGNNYLNWDGRINSNVGIQSTSDMRAPIFYDSADTGYYLDPNGLSTLSHIRLNNNWANAGINQGAINIRGQYPSMIFRNTVSDSMWLRHMDASGTIQHYYASDGVDSSNWSIKHSMFGNGNFYSSGTHTASQFNGSGAGLTGTASSLSVNFANSSTSAAYLNYTGVGATQLNANTFSYGRASNYYGTNQILNSPENAYASLYNFGGDNFSALSLQLFASVNHNDTSSTRNLWFRVGNNLGFQNDWKQIIHSGSIGSQSVSYAATSGSISGFNNPTTASTANTIVYRDPSGDIAAREFVLTAATVHSVTPSSIVGIYPTTNQVVKFGDTAIKTFLGLGSLAYSSATIPTNNNQLTNGAGYITSSALSSYVPITGTELTEGNYFYFRSNRGSYLGGLDSPSLQAYATGGNAAFMSFHRAGNYAVNFGLDADNIMRIGGWSASADRWVLDMSGNNTVAGSFRAPIFYDSNDTNYYLDPNSNSNLTNLSIVGYQSIGGTTSNGQSNFQWDGATYQNPNQWTARLILRRDNASTGVNGSMPSLVIFNNNGADQTTASMVFASNECVVGSNSVNLAGIVAKKESVGNCGGWSSGSLNFFVKNFATRIDSLALTPDGNATFSGLVYSTGYGNSSQWNTAFGWGNHASAGYLTSLPSHNHDDRYYTESESDGRYAYKAGAAGQDFSADKLSSYHLRNHYSVSTDHSYGMYFDNNLSSAYGIYRESGSWDHPYPDLRIAFHTGIKLGANSGYQGIKFYTDYDMVTQVMSVNNGSDPLGAGNVYVNNSLQAGSSLRAPIFYDSNDTGYYGDFASTSVMNAIRFGTSTNNGTLSGAGDWGMRLTTDSGNISFGPANSNHAHIYTDRPNFYFNKDLLVNNSIVITAATIGSQSVSYASTSGSLSSMNISQFTNNSGYITGISFANVSSKPTTISGYGITDAITTANIGSQSVSYATTAGSAPANGGNSSTVGGYSVSVAGTANTIPTRNGSGYLIPENWIQLNGIYGLYSPTNNAHLRPNDGSYGSWLITGSRNAWRGIEFDSGSAGNVTMMISADSNTSGFHNNSYGWQIRWANGTLYVGKNSYGGGDVAVLDASNYSSWAQPIASAINTGNIGSQSVSYATTAGTANAVAWGNVSSKPSLLMYYQGFTLDANTMDGNSTGFTYSVNAPYTGPIARFSEAGYSLQLNAAYSGGGTGIAFRTRNGDAGSFNPWRVLLNDSNYTSYSPSLTGSGASGTWGISVTGSAGSVAWTNVSSRPTALSQFTNDLGNYGGWQSASTAITTSNIGSQSVNYANYSGYSNLVSVPDWRDLNYQPNQFAGNRVGFHFNNTSTLGGNSDFWMAVQTVSPWSSYDASHRQQQLLWGGSGGLSFRYATSATTWSGWSRIYSDSYRPYADSAGSATTAGSATSASQLTKYGDIYGQDWNSYYLEGKFIAAAVYGMSGANKPPTSYDYGVALSYGESTGPRLQWYFPENQNNIGTIFRKGTYRTGWNGTWSNWKTLVEQEGNLCTIVGGNGTGLEVHGNVGYNQDPLTYFLLRGQADTSWKAVKIRLTGDAGGQDIEFRRIAENGADSRMWYVPRGGNTVNFEYPIVQPSDSRLKDNITPITTPVEKIKALSGVEFDWNSGEQVGTHDVGLIAQDVEAVLPEAVTTQEDGYKNLAYTKVIPLLVEAMKEQQTMIEALRAEIELLKHK